MKKQNINKVLSIYICIALLLGVTGCNSVNNEESNENVSIENEEQQDLFVELEKEDLESESVEVTYTNEISEEEKQEIADSIEQNAEILGEKLDPNVESVESTRFDASASQADVYTDVKDLSITDAIDTSELKGEYLKRYICKLAEDNGYKKMSIVENAQSEDLITEGNEDCYSAYVCFDDTIYYIMENNGSMIYVYNDIGAPMSDIENTDE